MGAVWWGLNGNEFYVCHLMGGPNFIFLGSVNRDGEEWGVGKYARGGRTC